MFGLNCSTSLTPATTVTWTKDGEVLNSSDTFVTNQYIRNGQQTIYDNTLNIDLPAEDILGIYSCAVTNMISSTAESYITIEGNGLTFIVISYRYNEIILFMYRNHIFWGDKPHCG